MSVLLPSFSLLLCFGLLLGTTVCAADAAWPPDVTKRADRPVRVACVGDSLTSGFKLEHPATDAYPAQLGRLLGAGWEVRGFAQPGRTALKNTPAPLWKEAVFMEALTWQPEVVIICLGTNDSWPALWTAHQAEFSADLADMVAIFRALPSKPRIWLALPTPMFLPATNVQLKTMAEEINPAITKVAQAQQCGLIDFYTALAGKPELLQADTVHPLPTGAAVMAATAKAALLAQP